ncbi:MAG: YvcK family protein [Firmicutes bacterium]|nr:YvcK family protein [Bacillota bacterium]
MVNIVAMGGGTGLSILLRGLKEISNQITAVVTVADDGGGSGVLREDLGMLPPGDVRNCILALANKEPILQDLFHYRFQEGRLKGQNFGNLMIAAMVGISDSFEAAIKKISDIFAITGEVFPVSEEDMILYARLSDGTIVAGESNIPLEVVKRGTAIDSIWVEPKDAKTYEVVLDRIKQADMIVLGPGSLFTSIIPNLLLHDVVEAINASSAPVFYVTNIMTQPGETGGFTAADHLDALLKHTALKKIDYLVANNGSISLETASRYFRESAEPVFLSEEDRKRLNALGVAVIEGDFVEEKVGYVRHNAHAISHELIKYIEKVYKD